MSTTLSREDATTALATPQALAFMRRILIDHVPVGGLFTVDDIASALTVAQVTGPAVGACFTVAKQKAWIEATRETRASGIRANRGRQVRVWRRLAIGPQGKGPKRPRVVEVPLFDRAGEPT